MWLRGLRLIWQQGIQIQMGRTRKKLTFSQFPRHARNCARNVIYGIEVKISPRVSGLKEYQGEDAHPGLFISSVGLSSLLHQIVSQSQPKRQLSQRQSHRIRAESALRNSSNLFMVQIGKLRYQKAKAYPVVIQWFSGRARQKLKSDSHFLNSFDSVWSSKYLLSIYYAPSTVLGMCQWIKRDNPFWVIGTMLHYVGARVSNR